MLVAAGSAHTDGSSNSNNVQVESFRHGAWTAQPNYPHENTKIGMYSAVTIGNELWYFGKNLTPRGCEIWDTFRKKKLSKIFIGLHNGAPSTRTSKLSMSDFKLTWTVMDNLLEARHTHRSIMRNNKGKGSEIKIYIFTFESKLKLTLCQFIISEEHLVLSKNGNLELENFTCNNLWRRPSWDTLTTQNFFSSTKISVLKI